MEFFDFTGTNEDEKAQVADIISHESAGVEFYFDYENVNKSANNNNNPKFSRPQINGLTSQNGRGNVQSQQERANNYNSQISITSAPIQNWELMNNVPTNSPLLPNAIAIPPNGASPPVVCGSPYMFQPQPYFTAPHPNPMYVSPPISGTMPPMAAHPKDLKHMRMTTIPNIPSSTQKYITKNSHINNGPPNCDNRNFYNMQNYPAYSEPSHIVDNSRLNNQTSAISISGDGGDLIGEPNAMTSNGPPVGVHPHMAPPPHPYAHHYHSHYPQPAFLPPFTQPYYFFPHEHPYHPHHMYGHPPFAHHPNQMNSPNASIDLTPQSNNQYSSAMQTTTSPSATTTLSNLSSSSVSASSTSIAAAYHSSHSSQSGTPTSFDQAEESNGMNSNSSFAYGHEAPNNSVEDNQVAYLQNDKQVPTESNFYPDASIRSTTNSAMNYQPSLESQVPNEKQTASNPNNEKESDSSNKLFENLKLSDNQTEIPENETTNTSHYSPVLNQSFSSSSSSAQNQTEPSHLNVETQEDPENYFPSTISNDGDPNQSVSSTWASKLFGSTHAANVDSSQNKQLNSSNKAFIGNTENNKSNLTNGDYPELHNFKSASSQNNNRIYKNRQINLEIEDTSKITIISMKQDSTALKLAKRLRDSIHLKHSLPTIMPCGLVNRGNWCYVNATLQALLACPPFYNIMREIGETYGIFRHDTSTPIVDNFARYFHRFIPTDFKKQAKAAGAGALSYLEELLNNDPCEPRCIYDTLKHIGMIKDNSQKNNQEDAEEFLSSVLNGLHEEMIKLSNFLTGTESAQADRNTKTNGFGDPHDLPDIPSAEDDTGDMSDNNIWHEVGTAKHKALPTRSTKVISTAITEIFGGSTIDVRMLNQEKAPIANRQPFFALQLDIKSQNIKTLEDAIRNLTRREKIQDYTCPKTKQIVEASSQTFLETVPPILILHLKLFDYDMKTGAGQKVLKRIDFPENFDIPRECFSRNNDSRQIKKYKLLAVVYHNGSETVKGHYITDVYHLGLNQWLRCDDASIKVISLNQVLAPGESGTTIVPYLLFYRRQDTLYNPLNTTANNFSSVHQAQNGKKMPKSMDNTATHFTNHNDASTINTSNKFNFISRHN